MNEVIFGIYENNYFCSHGSKNKTIGDRVQSGKYHTVLHISSMLLFIY